MDTRRRSWVKSISWRIIGIVVLGGVTYAVTGNWKDTGLITVLFHSIRVLLYYWHERLWEKISWGKLKHPLSCLPVKKDLTPQDYKIIKRLLDEHKYSAKEMEYQI